MNRARPRAGGRPDRPLVSIIIPAFNAETTLAETVQCALASTYIRIEVIIVDDGSRDRTAQLAAQLAADPRVWLTSRSHGGLPAALNTGVAAAQGEFVARLDADDLWHPTKLEKQMALATQEPSPDFIYSFYRYIDEQGLVLFDGPPQRFPGRALHRSVYETLIGTGSSLLMRKTAVEQLGGFDEYFANSEDLLFQVKAAARYTIAYVPEYLVGYRLRPNSVSSDAEAMRVVWFQLRRTLKDLFPQLPAYVHDWAHARRCMSMAEGFTRNRRYLKSIRLLLSALWFDPLWSSQYLPFRVARFVKQRIAPRATARPRLPFLSLDPETPNNSDSGLYGTEGRMMRRLHERRIRLLSSLDVKRVD